MRFKCNKVYLLKAQLVNNLKYAIFLCLYICISINLFSIEIEVIKNPKPTCSEKNIASLVLIKSISNIDDKTFFAQPTAMTADANSNIYIYDSLHCKIFKFDKNNKFIISFGGQGANPGTFGKPGNFVTIGCGKDGNLYTCENMKKRVMVFSVDGKHIKNYKITPWRIFQPVVDEKGNFYLPSSSNGMVDVEDLKSNRKTTLLSENEYRRCLFINPTYYFSRAEIFSNYFNTDIYLLSDSNILIYNRNASTFYLLDKNYRLKRKANLWPENALNSYQKRLLEFQKDEDFENAWIPFFRPLFIDGDEKNIFYLQARTDEFKVLLYAFDLRGQLVKVLKIGDDELVRFKCKQNNLFYGFGSNNDIKIYKEGIK